MWGGEVKSGENMPRLSTICALSWLAEGRDKFLTKA